MPNLLGIIDYVGKARMIEFKTGNLLAEDAEALVNTVNCVGVMGRGIALQFKKNFPENFRSYADACRQELVQPGSMFVHELGQLTNPRYIINFPTKRHWRGKSKIEDIESGLVALKKEILERGIQSIAIPPLGSGLGGLRWSDVRSRIESELIDLPDVAITVFEPGGGPTDSRPNRSSDAPSMTEGRAALVELMDRYVRGLLDPGVTLLEVHKLMYFLQLAGQPLKLKYKKALYGPYAENLRHVLNAIEGHFVSGYYDGGDAPDKELSIIPGTLEQSKAVREANPTMAKNLARVSDLVEGFESPFGLELLATVHWLIAEEYVTSIDKLVAKTYAWNSRKKRFTERQLGIAARVLADKGWAESIV